VVFLFSCVDLFPLLGVQDGHSFEPIQWLFAVGDVFALSLTFPQTLVSCSSCLPRHLCRQVLCDYPVVEGMGYQEVEGVCAGMVVLNPEYQSTHNDENQSYIGMSIGVSLAD